MACCWQGLAGRISVHADPGGEPAQSMRDVCPAPVFDKEFGQASQSQGPSTILLLGSLERTISGQAGILSLALFVQAKGWKVHLDDPRWDGPSQGVLATEPMATVQRFPSLQSAPPQAPHFADNCAWLFLSMGHFLAGHEERFKCQHRNSCPCYDIVTGETRCFSAWMLSEHSSRQYMPRDKKQHVSTLGCPPDFILQHPKCECPLPQKRTLT